MKSFLIFFIFSFTPTLWAQQEVKGIVTTQKGDPIAGANIFLEGTYDGATSDAGGFFSFTTRETGLRILTISFVSFETQRIELPVEQMSNLKIKLREDVTGLDAVVISAGSFSAGDNSKISVLKPLDVVTTAGVAGDFIAALQTLPGTSFAGEDGRLLVRGGTAEETKVFIDGLQVFQPYSASANNLPSRGRFSPFLFDGITFSSGGYSAEFGQALSAVLLLHTIQEPQQTETNISVMSVGAGLGHTQKWKKSSLSLSSNYINLAPYLELIPNNEQAKFTRPYKNLGGEAIYRKHLKNGIFKWYAAYEHTTFQVLQPNINSISPVDFALKNHNLYTNLSYKASLGSSWSLASGLSFSSGENKLNIDETAIQNLEIAAHLKLKLSKRFSNRLKLHFGTEYIFRNFSEETETSEHRQQDLDVQPDFFASFAEADLTLSKGFALKAGLRSSHLFLQKETRLSPRLSMALKTGKNGQVSVAYGTFLQQPEIDYLKFNKALKPGEANHYILNYQWTLPGYTLRAEAFHKQYSGLVRYDTKHPQINSNYNNLGKGYAKGIDLFYRDDKSIDNMQYWISYSYIDSERLYQNFPVPATPGYLARHTASLVTKNWLSNLRSQVGFTYNFASGRPFEDPNHPGYMKDKTRNYNSLSFNWAYLLSPQKILYFSASNILGYKNVYNYEYATAPNSSGIFEKQAITPAADRFFFVGFFWTISKDKTKNQLDTL